MALGRLDIPAVVLYTGSIAPGKFQGRDVTVGDVYEAIGAHAAGKLTAEELTGGVFSVSNLGTMGVDRFTAIVNPPEAAILAVGRVSDRVIAQAGQAVVRPVATLTLSVDHRVADGAAAARFLDDIATALEAGVP